MAGFDVSHTCKSGSSRFGIAWAGTGVRQFTFETSLVTTINRGTSMNKKQIGVSLAMFLMLAFSALTIASAQDKERDRGERGERAGRSGPRGARGAENRQKGRGQDEARKRDEAGKRPRARGERGRDPAKAALELMEKFDKNNDSSLSIDELTAAIESLQDNRSGRGGANRDERGGPPRSGRGGPGAAGGRGPGGPGGAGRPGGERRGPGAQRKRGGGDGEKGRGRGSDRDDDGGDA